VKPFKDFFYESVSNIVWHISNSPLEILKSDKFSLGTETGPDSTKSGKAFYLSTARSKTGTYSKSPTGIMFKLNGSLLNQRFKGKAIDYWAGSGLKDRSKESNEMEDRIYSSSPVIPNARKYIMGIYCWISSDYDHSYAHYIKKVEEYAKELNIPMIFFSGYKDFIQNKNPKSSLDDILNLSNIEKPTTYKWKDDYKRKNIRKIVKFLAELKDVDRNYSRYDSKMTLSADYGNYLRREHDKFAIQAKRIIAKIMRKLKINNIDKLIDMRIKQVTQMSEHRQNLDYIDWKLKNIISAMERGDPSDFNDFYDFVQWKMDGSEETLNELFKAYRSKDIDKLSSIFNIAKSKMQKEIDNINKTLIPISVKETTPKEIDHSWKEVQI